MGAADAHSASTNSSSAMRRTPNNPHRILLSFLLLLLSLVLPILGATPCTFNTVLKKQLCSSASLGSTSIDIGSPNGKYAFIVSDGKPRIIQTGKIRPLWSSALAMVVSFPCAKYAILFTANPQTIRLTCQNVTYGAISVTPLKLANNKLLKPNKISIDNNGVVLFTNGNKVIARIRPGSSKPNPNISFTKLREPLSQSLPTGEILNAAPRWMIMPSSWCHEVVWVRVSKGNVQCEKNTAPNAQQNKDPIENCVYRYRCVRNATALPSCDYGNGYLGEDGYRPAKMPVEWFTLIPRGQRISYNKEMEIFWPVKELAWLAFYGNKCFPPNCGLQSLNYYLNDYTVDCGWEDG